MSKIRKNICCFLCFKITLSKQREVQRDNNWKFTYYMVCVSYKKKYNKVKQSEVQTVMPQKFNYLTQCKKRHVKNIVKFKQTCLRSSTTSRSAFPFAMNAEIMISPVSNLLQNGRNIICVNSSPRSEKVKKYCERGLYKRNIICVTLKNGSENYKPKYVIEVQRENSRKFDYYSERI